MRFVISRTSAFWDNTKNKPPCVSAFSNRVDQVGDPVWEINIETLEDLLAFKEQICHHLVLGTTFNGEQEIEIYDDYRE